MLLDMIWRESQRFIGVFMCLTATVILDDATGNVLRDPPVCSYNQGIQQNGAEIVVIKPEYRLSIFNTCWDVPLVLKCTIHGFVSTPNITWNGTDQTEGEQCSVVEKQEGCTFISTCRLKRRSENKQSVISCHAFTSDQSAVDNITLQWPSSEFRPNNQFCQLFLMLIISAALFSLVVISVIGFRLIKLCRQRIAKKDSKAKSPIYESIPDLVGDSMVPFTTINETSNVCLSSHLLDTDEGNALQTMRSHWHPTPICLTVEQTQRMKNEVSKNKLTVSNAKDFHIYESLRNLNCDKLISHVTLGIGVNTSVRNRMTTRPQSSTLTFDTNENESLRSLNYDKLISHVTLGIGVNTSVRNRMTTRPQSCTLTFATDENGYLLPKTKDETIYESTTSLNCEKPIPLSTLATFGNTSVGGMQTVESESCALAFTTNANCSFFQKTKYFNISNSILSLDCVKPIGHVTGRYKDTSVRNLLTLQPQLCASTFNTDESNYLKPYDRPNLHATFGRYFDTSVENSLTADPQSYAPTSNTEESDYLPPKTKDSLDCVDAPVAGRYKETSVRNCLTQQPEWWASTFNTDEDDCLPLFDGPNLHATSGRYVDTFKRISPTVISRSMPRSHATFFNTDESDCLPLKKKYSTFSPIYDIPITHVTFDRYVDTSEENSMTASLQSYAPTSNTEGSDCLPPKTKKSSLCLNNNRPIPSVSEGNSPTSRSMPRLYAPTYSTDESDWLPRKEKSSTFSSIYDSSIPHVTFSKYLDASEENSQTTVYTDENGYSVLISTGKKRFNYL